MLPRCDDPAFVIKTRSPTPISYVSSISRLRSHFARLSYDECMIPGKSLRCCSNILDAIQLKTIEKSHHSQIVRDRKAGAIHNLISHQLKSFLIIRNGLAVAFEWTRTYVASHHDLIFHHFLTIFMFLILTLFRFERADRVVSNAGEVGSLSKLSISWRDLSILNQTSHATCFVITFRLLLHIFKIICADSSTAQVQHSLDDVEIRLSRPFEIPHPSCLRSSRAMWGALFSSLYLCWAWCSSIDVREYHSSVHSIIAVSMIYLSYKWVVAMTFSW